VKLLADENVKLRLMRWLKASGQDITAADKGVKNSHLFEMAVNESRILLTNDTDFLNTTLYPLLNTPGRIVLRIFPPTLANQKASLEMFLSKISDKECAGKLVEVFNAGFEIRDL